MFEIADVPKISEYLTKAEQNLNICIITFYTLVYRELFSFAFLFT